jgi:ribose transport system substrate-binding protein
MGGRSVKNQIERVRGFKDYISKHSRIHISEIESSDSYLLEAELAAKKILKSNNNIQALFCSSALDGEGAVKAVYGLGLTGKVKIICFDDLPETLDNIRDGFITSTIVQKPFFMGYKAVNIIMDNIEGKHTRGVFLTNVALVNEDNLDQYKKEQGDYNK